MRRGRAPVKAAAACEGVARMVDAGWRLVRLTRTLLFSFPSNLFHLKHQITTVVHLILLRLEFLLTLRLTAAGRRLGEGRLSLAEYHAQDADLDLVRLR